MKIAIFLGILTLSMLFACAQKSSLSEQPPSPQTVAQEIKTMGKEAWQVEWEKALAEAKKEGKVVIYTGVPPITRSEITKGFKKIFEGIELEFVAGSGAELSQKIFAQRRAGLYLVDLYISGTTTMLTVLKPAGVFDPFEAALILPQVKDPRAWWQGRLPFVDKDQTIFSFVAGPGGEGNLLVNTEVIKPEEIKSYYDLLASRFREKIVMMDPTIAGKGERQAIVLATRSVLGWDYFREMVKQRPILTRNARLQAEWILQKKHLVGFSPDEGIVLEMREAGAPVKIFGGLKEDIYWVTGSFGQISLINKAPHPDAARIFVNWLLDREGGKIWAETTVQQSARVDVGVDHLQKAGKAFRREGISYYMAEDEEVILGYPELQKLLREIFSPLLK